MSAPNSIIIYRSRAEQEIDNIFWDNPDAAAVFGTVLLIALCTIFIYKALESRLGWQRTRKLSKWMWTGSVALGIPAGVLIGKFIGWLILAI